VLTGAFLSVVAATITLKTHGSVPMSRMALFINNRHPHYILMCCRIFTRRKTIQEPRDDL
jgi:hypothetical protein